jgi:beta-glucosidase
VEQLGALLGRQARQRGCHVLLAPTMNLHRSPLAGRNFECYSEDPLLSGKQAAAFIRGVQSEGVIATAKHFVGNDAEFERNTIDSVIDARALRELYLVPFELAVREGGALAIMTAYNRVNGRWVTERADLLRDLVRADWGFEGLVMTDWFGVADTVDSIAAGLDLEMPGPGRAYGPALAAAVTSGSSRSPTSMLPCTGCCRRSTASARSPTRQRSRSSRRPTTTSRSCAAPPPLRWCCCTTTGRCRSTGTRSATSR